MESLSPYTPESSEAPSHEDWIRKDIEDLWPSNDLESGEYLRQCAQWGRAMKGHLQSGVGALRGLHIGTLPQVRIEHGLQNKITLETQERKVYTLEYRDSDDSLHVFQNSRELNDTDLSRLTKHLSDALQNVNTKKLRLIRD